jgi:hypothetical protein
MLGNGDLGNRGTKVRRSYCSASHPRILVVSPHHNRRRRRSWVLRALGLPGLDTTNVEPSQEPDEP